MTPRGADGIAVFGGAFDPPHRTHVRIARAALEQLPVAELLVVPAGDHPWKTGATAPGPERLELCRIAFRDVARAQVDDREVVRGGASFTVDTLEQLALAHPGRELWLVIGSDNLPTFHLWRNAERILQLAHLAVFPREGTPVPASGGIRPAHVLAVQPDAVNATALRERLGRGERCLAELDPLVEQRVLARHLYGT